MPGEKGGDEIPLVLSSGVLAKGTLPGLKLPSMGEVEFPARLSKLLKSVVRVMEGTLEWLFVALESWEDVRARRLLAGEPVPSPEVGDMV